MIRKELLLQRSAWTTETSTPIVICSRVRLARNLEDYPFPHLLNAEGAAQVEQTVAQVLKEIKMDNQQLSYIPLTEINSIEHQVLIEKHLISPGLSGSSGARGVALAQDHRYAVMVNEEDHLRIQVLLPGKQLIETHRLATTLDDELEANLDFAYRENQGYLTACPTNVGTGLRASVMVHVPGLVMTKQVQRVFGALAHLGLAVRGLYGEGSQAFGHMFQVSNQITFGKSEEDILINLEAVTGQIVEHELQARELLRQKMPIILEDRVWRARGTLQNARILSSEDAMHLLSHDRLGSEMGILPKVKDSFATLVVDTRSGCLQYILGRELNQSQQDEERARLLRGAMSETQGTIPDPQEEHEGDAH